MQTVQNELDFFLAELKEFGKQLDDLSHVDASYIFYVAAHKANISLMRFYVVKFSSMHPTMSVEMFPEIVSLRIEREKIETSLAEFGIMNDKTTWVVQIICDLLERADIFVASQFGKTRIDDESLMLIELMERQKSGNVTIEFIRDRMNVVQLRTAQNDFNRFCIVLLGEFCYHNFNHFCAEQVSKFDNCSIEQLHEFCDKL